MIAISTIDKAGRLVLPKAVREELQIKPGDSLELETDEGQLTLRLARSQSRVRKKRGLWVLQMEGSLPSNLIEESVGKEREQRERDILGEER
ncbi:MAG TPA: AbrB/MazE/SpoVT family DNA-binding domain-containing protein [Terriglobales bacterium]|jgi:AbrB family looped-hinge helix DNA binding protein